MRDDSLATGIEESHPLGRLFDMDVIGTDGMKLSRGTYRKCIICGCQAQECARSRKHSVEELQAKIEELLNRFSIEFIIIGQSRHEKELVAGLMRILARCVDVLR